MRKLTFGRGPEICGTCFNMANNERTRKCCFCVKLLLIVILGVGSVGGVVPRLEGFRVESQEGFTYDSDGNVVLYSATDVRLRLFGVGFSDTVSISFATTNATRGSNCNDLRQTDPVAIRVQDESNTGTALVTVTMPRLDTDIGEEFFFFCLKEEGGDATVDPGSPVWVHQGGDRWVAFTTLPKPDQTTILPLWMQICTIILLLAFSGLFSGLNLGLMSLDKTELKILQNSGSPREKKYAKSIAPVRKRGNFLLCTILLGNVLVNNTLAILLDDLTGSGLYAILGSTGGIVIFGEIIPQAVCSRYGLAIGAKTIGFTWFFMVVTFPVAFPISLVLDLILGEEMGNVYNRERLRELLIVTSENMDLVKDEVNIITGALQLSKKTVKDIMTPITDVFMVLYGAILDFDTMNEIMKTGYSRVPIYEGERTNIVGILCIKDLAFIDPDDRTPLTTVCKFYNHPMKFVFEDVKLDEMLEEFKSGRSHMSFVQRVNSEGQGDPFYETVGVVTLEDVIEEIIQSEIVDETDTVADNRGRAPRQAQVHDFREFIQSENENYLRMSPQLTLATFQYLSTSVQPFKGDLISEQILKKLIRKNVIVDFRLKDANSPDCYIFRQGKPSNYFVLVLQGRVEVNIGKEGMVFEGGPFTSYGSQALQGLVGVSATQQSLTSLVSATDSLYNKTPHYIPDFTVKAISDVQYLKIHRTHYIAARRATAMIEKSKMADNLDTPEDHFANEWKRATTGQQNGNMDQLSHDNDSGMDGETTVRNRSVTQDSYDMESGQNPSSPLINSCEKLPSPSSKSEAASC